MSRKYNIIYGGAAMIEKPVFHIYTTGIINWGTIEEDNPHNLINRWNNGVRQSIIDKIPKKFNIEIHHYDLMLRVSKDPPDKLQDINQYIVDRLIPCDNQNTRVNSSEFIVNSFNSTLINRPYLVFDMAHVYSFLPRVATVKNNNLYSIPSDSNQPENEDEQIELHVLRTGFMGDVIPFELAKSDSFRIFDDGTVRTFVDQIIESSEYTLEEYDEPYDFIENIMKKIKRKLENKIIEYTDKKLFEIYEFANTFYKNNLTIIINSVISQIWENKPVLEIENNVVDIIIRNHIEQILEQR